MTSIFEMNKLALQYAIRAVPRMKELAAPLMQYLGICSFSYMRIYKDSSYLSLLNGYEEFNTKYFETIQKSDPHFIETMQNTTHEEPQFSIWPTDQKKLTPIFSLLDSYNIWHGFQITYRKENYCEMFSFSFDKQSSDKTAFFLKNIPLFIKFIAFFRTQAGDLIDDRDKKKIAVFPQKFCIDPVEINESMHKFLADINKPFLLHDISGNIVHLTKRESECFKFFTKNRTSKEIARLLDISPKTVEIYISNIKQKLGIHYKNQIFEMSTNIF